MSRVKPQIFNHLKEETSLDVALRPKSWEEYIGQEKVKENLKVMIEASKIRKETLDHLLFYGPPGVGKTTLAYLLAKELNTQIKIVSAPAIEKVGDLAALLTNLKEGEILFIDECHRLSKTIEEYLYPAMEEYKLHLILGKGPMAKTISLDLAKFTLIGATTRPALLSSPLRSRFGAIFQLDYYSPEDIVKILERSSKVLNIKAENSALKLIAKRSRFTPRIANRLLKRIRDLAQVKGINKITKDIALEALEMLQIDELGLEPLDREILKVIIEKFKGGPVGLNTLSAATSQEEDTILEVIEPYLLKLGLVQRTPRGRVATPLAYKHLGFQIEAKEQKALWE